MPPPGATFLRRTQLIASASPRCQRSRSARPIGPPQAPCATTRGRAPVARVGKADVNGPPWHPAGRRWRRTADPTDHFWAMRETQGSAGLLGGEGEGSASGSKWPLARRRRRRAGQAASTPTSTSGGEERKGRQTRTGDPRLAQGRAGRGTTEQRRPPTMRLSVGRRDDGKSAVVRIWRERDGKEGSAPSSGE